MPVSVSFMGDPPSPFAPPPVEIANPAGFAVTKGGAVTGVPRGHKK
jgi:hypothetical protein